ncbi:hypothetical protein HCR_23170 (plasmid) [Hydrogenimonas cancrithermarum]|uniref:Uncharacterized protein n=1 Tax=Hydrogenimonas cancrithermarum TaxID=2993563 RepID=A0ABM8FPP2_9BACT|nr:hypothetical protein HCR_23170 [Hydrogenimonas cancrithermarum]
MLQHFDDTLLAYVELFDRLDTWISDYLDDAQLKKLRVTRGLNLSQTVSLLLDQFLLKDALKCTTDDDRPIPMGWAKSTLCLSMDIIGSKYSDKTTNSKRSKG